MRRFKFFSLIISFCLIVVSFMACGSVKTPEDFYKKLNDSDNFTIEFDVKMQGMSMDFTLKIDGDKVQTSGIANMGEMYGEMVGEDAYLYTKVGDVWSKEKVDLTEYQTYFDSEVLDSSMFEELFESYEFEKDGDRYKLVLKEGIDDLDLEVEGDIYMEISGGNCIITYSMENVGDFTVTIKDVGKTKVTLPVVE